MPVLRFRLWLCVALPLFGQLPLRAQVFLVAQPPATKPGASRTLTIAWNPSPGTNVAGYCVYWGVASGACTNRLNIGNTTTATLGGFNTNANYFFTTVSYNALGQESSRSNEIQYSPQAAPTAAASPNLTIALPGRGGSGATLRLSFQAPTAGTYLIQSSRDLRHWNTVWITNSQPGLIVFNVTNWTNYPRQFYRFIKH